MLLTIGLIAFGLMTGVLSGTLGVGGGVFMVPFLVLVAGLGQHEAQATSLLVILPTAVVASWSLHRRGVGDLRTSLRMGAIGVVGGIAGTLLALQLSAHVLQIAFAMLLIIVALRLIRDALQGVGVD